MGWKNWGDHPAVVTVSVLAGLAGIIALGYTIFNASGTQQETRGNNSPNINTSNGDVRVNIDNSTKVQAPSTPEIPRYSGKIGHLEKGKSFIDFIFNHDGKVVYLNSYLDAFADARDTIPTEDDFFTLWSACNNLQQTKLPIHVIAQVSVSN